MAEVAATTKKNASGSSERTINALHNGNKSNLETNITISTWWHHSIRRDNFIQFIVSMSNSCRQRKKQEIEETRRERDRLREENQKLTAKLELCLDNEEKLRGQLEKLKMELLEHAHCSVSLKKRNAGVIQYPM